MRDRMIVEIKTATSQDDEFTSLEDEAEMIRDCLLEAHGYPRDIDWQVKVLSREILEDD